MTIIRNLGAAVRGFVLATAGVLLLTGDLGEHVEGSEFGPVDCAVLR